MMLVRHGESEFNVVYNVTREDPGIVDPGLTDHGMRQAEAVAEELGGHHIRRILVSPYSRTLHTAKIVAERRGLPVEVEPLVRERAFFACDIGSPRSELSARWPGFDFVGLPERWWPEPKETEGDLLGRCTAFRAAMASAVDWPHVAVISHWGFIRGLTGQTLTNGSLLRFDPTAA